MSLPSPAWAKTSSHPDQGPGNGICNRHVNTGTVIVPEQQFIEEGRLSSKGRGEKKLKYFD
ncbi:hypothetical protein MB02_02060 [Croceicoccus estronivorus]|nr:hypothetical protein MB02_02060 [Croceicoccus estronivorus]